MIPLQEFLERRRQAYTKRLDPAAAQESDSDEDEDEDEEAGDEDAGDENAPARANNVARAAEAEAEAEGLGSIAVKDGPSEQKREELRAFLQTELPEIQRSVALKARTLWWKQKEYDDKVFRAVRVCACVCKGYAHTD